MKLLYVTDTYFPVISGSAIIVERYAKEMVKRGHQVAILAMGDKLDLKVKNVSKNLKVYSVPSLKNLTRADHYIPIILPRQVKKITQNFNPDLIHVFSPGTLGIWLKKYANKNNIKTITSVFGVPEYATSFFDSFPRFIVRRANKLLWKYYSWFYKNIDAITVLSEFPKRELKDHGVKTKIEVIPMWVNNSKKCPANSKVIFQKHKIPQNKKIFLYLGRLDKDKDLDTLIKAFAVLISDGVYKKDSFLVIAGPGQDRENLEDLANQLGIQKHIQFTGLIDPEKVHEIYCVSDIFVMPGPYETQSIATVEAISYGLKAIVANSGALPEIEKRLPKDCFTYAVSNPNDLAEKMQKLLDKPFKKKFTPGKFHKFYSKKYAIDKLENLYGEVTS